MKIRNKVIIALASFGIATASFAGGPNSTNGGHNHHGGDNHPHHGGDHPHHGGHYPHHHGYYPHHHGYYHHHFRRNIFIGLGAGAVIGSMIASANHHNNYNSCQRVVVRNRCHVNGWGDDVCHRARWVENIC